MKQELKKAIQQFAKIHPKWRTPEGAFNECANATVQFLDFLKKRKINEIYDTLEYDFYLDTCCNPDTKIYNMKENSDVCEGHCIAKVGNFFIDWTARQYRASANFPHIIRVR